MSLRIGRPGTILVWLALVAGVPGAARAQDSVAADSLAPAPVGAGVVVMGDTLFKLYGRLGAFSAEDRAAAISARLDRYIRTGDLFDSVTVRTGTNGSILALGDSIIMTVMPADAVPLHLTTEQAAQRYASRISGTLAGAVEKFSFEGLLVDAAYAGGAILLLVLLLWLFKLLFPRIYRTLESWRGTRIPALRVQRLVLMSSTRLTNLLIAAARVARIVLTVVLLYFFIPLVLSFFPWTQQYAPRMTWYVLAPLAQLWQALVTYLPNLFYIGIIILALRYAIKVVHLVFRALRTGAVTLTGFHREWAEPTFKIVRFLMLAFAAVVLFPYLPGAHSDAFKGISIFLGVLFSLGSSSAIANVVSGVVLTYARAFEVGDRVRISDTTGDVLERTLLVTRVRTIKNVEVTIPNGMVLGSHIINYTTAAHEDGLILHTTVTIGYDAPWRQVHELLCAAATATTDLVDTPKPFVLQTALDDFYVQYEINAYTHKPARMAAIYAELHQNIQDKFNEAGVEIMSPHYNALRDGNQAAMPEETANGRES